MPFGTAGSWLLRCRTASKKTELFLSSGGYSGGTPRFASTEIGESGLFSFYRKKEASNSKNNGTLL